MDLNEIQTRLDGIVAKMLEKGKPTPDASFRVRSNAAPAIMTNYGSYPDNEYNAHSTLEAAEAWADALPSPEDAHRAEFLRLSAAAADYADAHLPGDPAAEKIRASIVEEMHRLSGSAITGPGTQKEYAAINRDF